MFIQDKDLCWRRLCIGRGQAMLFVSISQEPVIPYFHEPLGQDVQQEPSDKLVKGGE